MQLFSAIFNKQALMGCIFYKRVNMTILLDAGKLLKAKVNSVEKKGSMYKVAIGVYLFDF